MLTFLRDVSSRVCVSEEGEKGRGEEYKQETRQHRSVMKIN